MVLVRKKARAHKLIRFGISFYMLWDRPVNHATAHQIRLTRIAVRVCQPSRDNAFRQQAIRINSIRYATGLDASIGKPLLTWLPIRSRPALASERTE